MKRLRGVMLREAGMRLDDLVADYAFVRLGDLISLHVAQRKHNNLAG